MRPRNVIAAVCTLSVLAACGWDPKKPFDRNAPAVTEAIGALDAGDATAAATLLEEYLSTGACSEGSIGTPAPVRARPNGSLDLGLALFQVGEAFGQRFGDEEADAGPAGADAKQRRSAQIGCALAVVQAIAGDEKQAIDLRLHARYLEGNLHFLGGDYEEAVRAY